MLFASATHPAMLEFLDTTRNEKTIPNENYARELMELFTLGIGNYTQTDVTELARALTGWTVQNYQRSDNYNGATFVVNAAVHDGGDHHMLVGHVLKASFDPTLDPLLYFRGSYRRLHFD